MRRAGRPLAALLLALNCAGCATAPGAPAHAELPSLAPAIRAALRYTVGVYAGGGEVPPPGLVATDRPPAADDAPLDPEGLPGVSVGAGILLDASGLVATAAHVVAGPEPVVVRLPDERVLPAQRVLIDEDSDVALLRVATGWPAAATPGSSLGLSAGDWVLALGEPYGLERSAMLGIVSSAARHFVDDGELLFLQTTIGINPGHSGGPLADTRGRLVGMNLRAVVGPLGLSGLGLAVPIELVRQVAADLQSQPPVRRAAWGWRFEDLLPPEAVAAGRPTVGGAVVRAVRRGGLAAALGVAVGDIVVGLDGQPVGNGAELARLMRERGSGTLPRLVVFRAGAYRALPAR